MNIQGNGMTEDPDIAMDHEGNFVVVWTDGIPGDSSSCAKRSDVVYLRGLS